MRKSIMKAVLKYLSVFVVLASFLMQACDSKRNEHQTIGLSSTLEEIIFPSTDPNADTTKYEILLFDSTIDYFLKKKIYDTAQTVHIFLEDIVFSGGEMKLTRDVLKDSLLYVNQYCTSVDLVTRFDGQELLLASVSMDSVNPAPFVIKHPGNMGIYRLGKMYLVLRYNRKLDTKRYFKWDIHFDVRYSYDDN